MTTAALPQALPIVLHPRRLGMLVVAAFCDIGIWILAGFFAASEFYRRAIVLGGPAIWGEVLDFQMVSALNWAAFTPFIVFIAERLPLRPPHWLRNIAVLVALIPLLAVIRAAMGGAVLNLGEHDPISLDMVSLSIGIRTHRYIAIIAAIFFVHYLVAAQREAAERERQRVRAQTSLARDEIEDLRARLQPRFAVRMMRHIGDAIREKPGAADAQIVALSAILRRSMARDAGEQNPLADELEHFDRCLELCRAGGRFAVTARYVAGEDVLHCRVPSLVLQPVIERVALDLTSGAGGSVEVHCTREGEAIHIDVGWTVAPQNEVRNTALQIPIKETA
jgi:hypothetical protein